MVSGQDGTELFTVDDPDLRVHRGSPVAVGDIDRDGRVEIVAVAENQNRLIAFEHDGTVKWLSSNVQGTGDGSLRWTGTGGQGGRLGNPLAGVADLDLDGIPEIVAGRTAYRANGDIYWDHPELSDGWIAVADFDDDPFPEVVLVANGDVFLFEHSGEIKWGPVPIDQGGTGGPPLVADLDNDGEPEIGVAGRSRYQVFEHTGVSKWSVPISDGSSSITSSSAFDFEADGFAEVVYADERRLRVFDGTDGTVVFETEIGSATRLEYPIIADVDVDGKAEIVVVANEFNNPVPVAGIFVYGTPSERWVPTRALWNQYTYHITNINDDGTIPARESNNWELFNNYRQNVLIDGCVYALPDLTASFVRKETVGSDVVLTARLGNGGGNAAGPEIGVSFYNGDPASGGILLGTTRTESLAGRQFRDVSLIGSGVRRGGLVLGHHAHLYGVGCIESGVTRAQQQLVVAGSGKLGFGLGSPGRLEDDRPRTGQLCPAHGESSVGRDAIVDDRAGECRRNGERRLGERSQRQGVEVSVVRRAGLASGEESNANETCVQRRQSGVRYRLPIGSVPLPVEIRMA